MKYFLGIIAITLLLSMHSPHVVHAVTTTQPRLFATEESDAGETENAGEDATEQQQGVVAPSVPATKINTTTTTQDDQQTGQQTTQTSTVATETSANQSAVATTQQKPLPWPWLVTRASGLASYMLLCLIAITGILLTTGALYRIMSPALAWSLHRALGSILLFSIGAHIVGLLTDNFIKLRVVDVFVPFVSPYRPLLVALGIGGMYLMLLIVSTSLYTMTEHPKLWRTIHAFSFPMFLALFLHGILIGTDSHLVWVTWMYWSSASLVLLASIYRIVWRYHQPAKQA